MGEPFTIAKSEQYLEFGYWNFPDLRKCPNGELLLDFGTGGDAVLAAQVGTDFYCSHDLGKTWKPNEEWGGKQKSLSPRYRNSLLHYNKKAPLDGEAGGSNGGLMGFCNLGDGTCICYGYLTMRAEAPGVFVNTMWSSPDGGTTWQGPTDAEITVPPDSGRELGQGQTIWRRSVQLANGNLVTMADALFAGESKTRDIALGSSDQGRSWHYLSTVGYDPNLRFGFSEPIICQTADGRLICLMRTDGDKPMYQAFSGDGGQTWTQPSQAGVDGVAPDMRLLSNGVLACSYGRPGVNIMFSLDGTGNSWTNHTSIFEATSTSYTSFEEVSAGRLLFVFDAIHFKDAPGAAPANCIRGVYIDVARVEK
jgi:hypothetical protein